MCCLIFNGAPSVTRAGPEGAEVVHGQVSFQQSGLNTTIHASDKSIINYRSFDIARPEVVQFMQPSSSASVLNRILSANPTSIDGTLLANGRVFFVNPAGVIIGSGARINVNQLVASGLNISNDSFINGQYEFVGGGGTVANYGDISAQSVYLVGKQVTNVGNINCPDGYVVMAAGDRVFLGQPGSSVIVEIGSLEPPDQADAQPSAEMDTSAPYRRITNDGTVKAAGGTIILAAAGDAFSRPIMTNIGSLSTSNANGDAGNIGLQAGNGQIDNAGAITAISDSGVGGTVTANAGEVVNTGTIDASGTQGGTVALDATERLGQFGTIDADGIESDGGDINLRANEVVVLGEDSLTTANAGANGDGGEVIAYSPEITLFRNGGRIEAKGGSVSGNGGFLEVSGKEYVEVFGEIDLTATNGANGKVLIDPLDLWIVNGDTANGDVSQDPPGTWKPINTTSVSQLDIDVLEGYLGSADVTLSTLDTPDVDGQFGDIIFDADRYLESGDPTGYALTVEAARHIEFTAGDGIKFQGDSEVKLYAGGHITSVDMGTDTISTLRGDIIIEAGSDGSGVGIDVGRLTVGAPGLDYPGEIRLSTTDGGNITTESLSVKGNGYGSIYAFSSGDLTINGFSPAVLINTNHVPTGEDAFSFACLIAEEDVTIKGDVKVEAHGNTQSVAGIWIGAGTIVQDPENGYPGTVSIDGVVQADASASGALIEDATVKIYGNNIILPSQSSKTPIATTGSVWYRGTTTDYDASDDAVYEWDPDNPDSDPLNRNPLYDKLVSGSRALVVIDITKDGTCLNCGNVILPIALPDWLKESKNIGIYAIAVLANDEDGLGNILVGGTVDPDTLPPTSFLGGTLTLNPDGDVQYEPPADWVFDENGEFADYFKYYAVDADGDVSELPAQVTIVLINQLPFATGGYATTGKSDPVDIDDGLATFTLGGDGDSDGIWIDSVTGPSYGGSFTAITAEVDVYGEGPQTKVVGYTYTADASAVAANGSFNDSGYDADFDSFTYTVTDGLNTSTATAEVALNLTNQLPVADGGWATTPKAEAVSITEAGSAVSPLITFTLGSDNDVEDSVWVDSYDSSSLKGTVGELTDGSGHIIGFTYEATDLSSASFDGDGYDDAFDSFSYTVTDGYNISTAAPSHPGQVQINLTNQLPVADGGWATTPKADAVDITEAAAIPGVLEFYIGSDADGEDSVWVSSYDTASNGSLAPIYEVPGDETSHIIGLTYEATDLIGADFNPSGYDDAFDSFSYTVTDGYNYSPGNQGDVQINLTNALPVAQPDSYDVIPNVTISPTVDQGIIVGIIPAINGDFDMDGDDLTPYLLGGSTSGQTTYNGTVTLNYDGSFTYGPPAGWGGIDTFTYYVNDGYNNSDPVSVTITASMRTPTGEEASLTSAPVSPELGDIGQIEGAYVSDLLWLGEELGLCEGDQQGEDDNRCQEITQAYLAGAFLQASDLRPQQAAAQLRQLAGLLHDTDGSRIAALGRVINEFAQPDVPPSPEQFASIGQAFAVHVNDGTHYATAMQWLDALAEYTMLLISEIGWSQDDSIAFVMSKYGPTVTETGDVGIVAFIQMHLEDLIG